MEKVDLVELAFAAFDGDEKAKEAIRAYEKTVPDENIRRHACGRHYIPQDATYCWFCHCG